MDNSLKWILVTGAAGFIGSALIKNLLSNGENVIGIDNLNSYYDKNYKKMRLRSIEDIRNLGKWKFEELDINDNKSLEKIFKKYKPEIVVNLAAQAGVRYSLENPHAYVQSNLVGFINILEQCRNNSVKNFIYASSSSVYGMNKNQPFSESDGVNHPVSLYASTKKSNELLAHSYSHLFKIPCTGLRLFTVFGPWGRPDMAPMIFANSIIKGKPISVFNYGKMKRDFTNIDDVVEGITRCCYKPATKDPNFSQISPDASISSAPYRIFNIGNGKPIQIMEFIEMLENALNKKAIIKYEPIQNCDVEETFANTIKFQNWTGFTPDTSLKRGINDFVRWYRDFFMINN